MEGILSAAIKFLDKESSTRLLDLSPDILEGLKEKHPPASEIKDECLLNGSVDQIPPNNFDLINAQLIYVAAMKTRGSPGPSGMDADIYRRIMCSKNCSSEGKTLREEISTMTRNLMKSCYHPSLLESYASCRLIPLDKNPGNIPIRVGEVLRRIIGKTINSFLMEIKQAVGPLQVCAGHSTGIEAAIHAMSHVFYKEGTDGILFIHPTNAFNQMNTAVAIHSLQLTCNKMSMYIINTYRSTSRIFTCGGGEILSPECTTQCDPLAMPWYSVNTAVMIQSLRLKYQKSNKHGWPTTQQEEEDWYNYIIGTSALKGKERNMVI
jgi:hypothetical protein